MSLALATTNRHKVEEAQGCLDLLGLNIQVMALAPKEDVAETGDTFEANARIKLEAALAQGIPPEVMWVVAEDSGLIVEALDGTYGHSPFPGVCSDRWLTPAVEESLLGTRTPNPGYAIKNQALLALMQNKPNRQAAYVACLAIYTVETQQTQIVWGQTPLKVATQPQGDGGFGYDPVMIPQTPGDTRTFAQRTAAEKNSLSHRFAAWQAWGEVVGSLSA